MAEGGASLSSVSDLLISTGKLEFEWGDPIGRGGYGVVYRGLHEDLGTVALKTLITDGDLPERSRNDLKKEARRLRETSHHPNIINLHGIIMEKGNYSLVLEYVVFGNVNQFINDYPVDTCLRVRVISQVADAMGFLHSQSPPILHLDLKADNVLIDNQFNAKVCDFGLSVWKTTCAMVTRGAEQGGRECTCTHVPPELFSNVNLPGNMAYDIYCFGITMWEILSGMIPYRGQNDDMIRSAVLNNQRPDILALQPQTNFQLKQMMLLCWQQQAQQRPSFSKLKATIQPVLTAQENKIVPAIKKIRKKICEKFFVNDLEYIDTEYVDDIECKEINDVEDQPIEETNATRPESVEMETNETAVLANQTPQSDFPLPVANIDFPLEKREFTGTDLQIRSFLRDPVAMMLLNSGEEDCLGLSCDSRMIVKDRDKLYKYLDENPDLKFELERCNHSVIYELNSWRAQDSSHRGNVEAKEKASLNLLQYNKYGSHKSDNDLSERDKKKKRCENSMTSSFYGRKLSLDGRGQKLLKALNTPYHLQDSLEESKTGPGGAQKFDVIDPKIVEDAKDPILLHITLMKNPECLESLMRSYPEMVMKLLAANKHEYRENKDSGGRRSRSKMQGPTPNAAQLQQRQNRDEEERKRRERESKMGILDSRKAGAVRAELSGPSLERPADTGGRMADFANTHHRNMDDSSTGNKGTAVVKMKNISDDPRRSEWKDQRLLSPQNQPRMVDNRGNGLSEAQLNELILQILRENPNIDNKQKEEASMTINAIRSKMHGPAPNAAQLQQRQNRDEEERKRRERESKMGILDSRKASAVRAELSGPSLESMKPHLSASIQSVDMITAQDADIKQEPHSSTAVSDPVSDAVPIVTSKDQCQTVDRKPHLMPSDLAPEFKSTLGGKGSKQEPQPSVKKKEKKPEDKKQADAAYQPAVDNQQNRIIHKHSGGAMTVMSFGQKALTGTNMQVGDKNMMYVGAGTSRHKEDDEEDSGKKKKSKRKRKITLTTSTKPLSSDCADEVCRDIGKDWRKLGRVLGVSDTDLERIDQDFNTHGIYEVTYKVLQKWRQLNGGKGTFKAMAEALHSIDRDDLAKKMKEK